MRMRVSTYTAREADSMADKTEGKLDRMQVKGF